MYRVGNTIGAIVACVAQTHVILDHLPKLPLSPIVYYCCRASRSFCVACDTPVIYLAEASVAKLECGRCCTRQITSFNRRLDCCQQVHAYAAALTLTTAIIALFIGVSNRIWTTSLSVGTVVVDRQSAVNQDVEAILVLSILLLLLCTSVFCRVYARL